MNNEEFHLISDDRVEEMQTRIAELEEALRPFAFRDLIEDQIPPDALGHYELFVEAEDICHARKVLGS